MCKKVWAEPSYATFLLTKRRKFVNKRGRILEAVAGMELDGLAALLSLWNSMQFVQRIKKKNSEHPLSLLFYFDEYFWRDGSAGMSDGQWTNKDARDEVEWAVRSNASRRHSDNEIETALSIGYFLWPHFLHHETAVGLGWSRVAAATSTTPPTRPPGRLSIPFRQVKLNKFRSF